MKFDSAIFINFCLYKQCFTDQRPVNIDMAHIPCIYKTISQR